MSDTPQQEAIIESPSDFLRVNAFAGTGKTFTLTKYALRRPKERFLYIAFNQSIKQEATRKFPKNVKCLTSHGLAFSVFGAAYADAGKLVKNLDLHVVVDALGLGKYPQDFRLYVADLTLSSLNNFMASADAAIDPEFIDNLITPGSGITTGDIAIMTKKLWLKMIDLKDASVGMVHDGYLKLYQLSNPTLNYGTILFDEAQDANPVTAALVETQLNARKVIVGDGHQQLYSFRGANNAMAKFKATQTLHLTRSFRFGQGIADVANIILSNFKGETRELQGTASPAHIGHFPRSSAHAVIARANATLFDEAAQAIALGKTVHFLGGIEGYRIGQTMDAYNLWSGNHDRINTPKLKLFKTFDQMEVYAGAADDKELKSLIGLVKRHGSKLPRLTSQIKSGVVDDMAQANIILTTAHKAKGMEWNNVRLTHDYIDLLDKHGKPRKLTATEKEEANIVYVAATRAKRALCPFPDLETLIKLERNKARTNLMPDWARPATNPHAMVAQKAVTRRA